MAWSAGCLLAGVAIVAARAGPGLARARAGAAARAAMLLAFANLLAAGSAGLLIGLDRRHAVLAALPGGPILPMRLAFAHAHLAALGWALLMIAGIGSRMIPMILPAPLRDGGSLWVVVALLQIGAWGLFAALLGEGGVPAWPFAACAVLGLLAFVRELVSAARSRRRAPPGMPSPDPALLQVAASFAWLSLAAVAGIAILAAPDSESGWALRGVYGVGGLLGGLGQMVAGVGGRFLPIWSGAALAQQLASNPDAGDPPTVAQLRRPGAGWALLVLWNLATAALAAGVFRASEGLVRAGALLLLAAVVASAWQAFRVLSPPDTRG
jgi:hypothetical protein